MSGLPQGGALLPFLWLLHFDNSEQALMGKRQGWAGRIREARARAPIYADDVAPMVEHADQEIVVAAAPRSGENVDSALWDRLGLALSKRESFKIEFPPGQLLAGKFRL